ncbi:MAG: ccmC [Nitrospirae bacterium]|nr:MAG: ccmC [Nitrospirota bacterium]
MQPILMLIIGLPLFLFVFVGPIYCAFKMAKFKNRNSVIWKILAVVPVTTVPIFLVLSFMPSVREKTDNNTYDSHFTAIYDSTGYILTAICSILFVAFFYFRLYATPVPLVPALQNSLLHIHVPLALIAYSFAIATFILSIIRAAKDGLFPRAILKLQSFAILLFYSSIIFGSIWAEIAWGSYWTWDPKETWSLILLSLLIAVTTYLTISVPGKTKGLLMSLIQVAVITFVFFLDKILSGLHSYGELFY